MFDLNFATISNHLILIGIYCILALSLNLINGSLGAFSLGHHGFWCIGAYLSGIVGWTFGSTYGSVWVLGLSFIAATLVAAFFGLLVGMTCLRFRGDYLAIVTLGFAETFIICARNSESWKYFGERGLGGAAGFSLGDTFHEQPYRISGDDLSGNDTIMALCGGRIESRTLVYLILTWVLVACVFLLIRNLLRSGHGRAITAIRDDQTAAELVGVNLIRYKLTIFVIGASLAGLAGALLANYRSTISPNQFLMMESIKILLMCVLGGLGSMSGTVLAVFLLYTSEQVLGLFETPIPLYIWSSNSGSFRAETKSLGDLWQVVFALLLILLMLLRPNGIMGRRELSISFFRDLFKEWKNNPLQPLATFAQFIVLILGLHLSQKSIRPLLAAFSVILGLHIFKVLWGRRHARKLSLVLNDSGGPSS